LIAANLKDETFRKEQAATVTAQEVMKRLHDDGWYEVKQSGSHKKFKNESKTGIVTVTMHKGDIPKGTLAGIFRQAGWERQP